MIQFGRFWRWTGLPYRARVAQAPVSDVDFAAFLLDERRSRCYLVEADYMLLADKSLATEYMSTHPFVSQPSDAPANQVYAAMVLSMPSFKEDMSDAMSGHTTANLGEVAIRGGTAATDDWVFDRDWLGRSMRIYVGDPSWDRNNFRIAWTGVIGDVQSSGTNSLKFEARDMQHLLNQPLRTAVFDSGPSLSQPANAAIGGTIYNVTCTLVDATTHTYRLNDGPVYDILAVRIAGVNQPFFTKNLAQGTFALSFAATGIVTADFVGSTPSTGVTKSTAADMIQYLVVNRGYFTMANIDIDAFNALRLECPQPLALNVSLGEKKIYEAVDLVAYTVGAFTSVDAAGMYYARRFDFDDPSEFDISPDNLAPNGLSLEKVVPPVSSITFGSQKNETPGSAQEPTVAETEIAQNQNRYRAVGRKVNPRAEDYQKTRVMLPLPLAPLQPDGTTTIDSLFVNPADAEAEAARRMELWGVPRYVFKCVAYLPPFRVRLGTAVTIWHPRYKFQNGRKGVVIGVENKPAKARVDLRVIL